MTRSQSLLKAIEDHIRTAQHAIDLMPGMRGVTFTVKLKPNGDIRTVIMGVDTESPVDSA